MTHERLDAYLEGNLAGQFQRESNVGLPCFFGHLM